MRLQHPRAASRMLVREFVQREHHDAGDATTWRTRTILSPFAAADVLEGRVTLMTGHERTRSHAVELCEATRDRADALGTPSVWNSPSMIGVATFTISVKSKNPTAKIPAATVISVSEGAYS